MLQSFPLAKGKVTKLSICLRKAFAWNEQLLKPQSTEKISLFLFGSFFHLHFSNST